MLENKLEINGKVESLKSYLADIQNANKASPTEVVDFDIQRTGWAYIARIPDQESSDEVRENLDKIFIKRENKRKNDIEIQIYNDLDGLFNYLTAPNIRHKVIYNKKKKL